ncbi:6610_t:CDS:2 [Gigaspora margarita]|uniref:6610_t:CDS:1 n=1 Tax=Gigaspora margarita TaxID=4874 RepID=A0ABM8W498_GIGMA|nr:6610_t:CDS:2 [Gigaspora margarita]
MTDVAHSVSLDQRLDCPHDPVSFPQYSNIPTSATFAATTPSFFSANQQFSDSSLAPFGGFDLSSGETSSFEAVRPLISVNLFEPQNWHAILAVMNFQFLPQQQSDQDLSHSPQQNSRHFNDMATYQYSSVDVPMLQPPATPPFVEPSANYFAVPTTTTSNLPLQSSPYFNSTLSATLPAANNINNVQNSTSNNVTANNASVTNTRNYSNSSANSYGQGTQTVNTDYNNNNFISQRTIYNSIPSTIHQQKPIPRTINTNVHQSPPNSYSRPNSATTSPINSSIAPPLFALTTIAQTLNTDGHGNNTMHLPMFESNNNLSSTTLSPWTTKAPTTITIPTTHSDTSSKSTSPTTPTYSYSGPPKSYYSRLPLYDRPFKCDQCPQSFNRNHDLKRHKRIHLAVKPYPCPYCEKQFSRKDALKRHILVKGCNNNSVSKSESLSTTNATGNATVGESRQKYDTSPIENYVDNRIP